MALTDSAIRNAKATDRPYKFADGGGLYVEVRPTGAKLWRYRYRIDQRENVFAMGEYARPPAGETPEAAAVRLAGGKLTLQEARAEHGKARALVKQGIHPAKYRKDIQLAQDAERANTFEAVAKEWIDNHKTRWSPYYLRQVERFLAADVFPHVGTTPVRNVNAAAVLQVLRRIDARGASSVAHLVRQWCSAIFRYAIATLRADADPAAALKGSIRRLKAKHHKPLARADFPVLDDALDRHGGNRTTVIALRLLLLTFVRTVELRMAEWEEIDLERAEWRIPASRMKMRELHIVPLSKKAVDLLRELHTLTGGQKWLFPNQRRPKLCMSATTLNRALERMGFNGKGGKGFAAHGFRATASTFLNENGFRTEAIERQLAHAERNKVRASYNRAEYLDERRAMMQAWADMVDDMVKADRNAAAAHETNA